MSSVNGFNSLENTPSKQLFQYIREGREVEGKNQDGVFTKGKLCTQFANKASTTHKYDTAILCNEL